MGGVVAYCMDEDYQPNPNKALSRRQTKILARGNNRDGHLGEEGDDCDRFAIEQWARLQQMEQMMKKKPGVVFDHLYINYESLMILNNASDIYVVGNNNNNKLGVDDKSEDDTLYQFTQIPFDKEAHGNPIVLSQGIHSSECSFVYTERNKLFVSGLNRDGIFGNGTTNDEPVVLMEIDSMEWLGKNEVIDEIHCGAAHSLFLTESGKLFGTGMAKCVGEEEDVLTPKLLHDGIRMVATGEYHTLLVNYENKLIIHGSDDSDSQITESGAKRKIQGFFNDADRSHLVIRSIHSGFLHGMVLCRNQRTKKDELFTFGNNEHGQIGNGAVINDRDLPVIDPHLVTFKDHSHDYVIQASSGRDHNVVLTNRNNVFAFGCNINNKCGNKQWPFVEKQADPFHIDLEDKENGLGLSDGLRVEKVMATNCATIIVVG